MWKQRSARWILFAFDAVCSHLQRTDSIHSSLHSIMYSTQSTVEEVVLVIYSQSRGTAFERYRFRLEYILDSLPGSSSPGIETRFRGMEWVSDIPFPEVSPFSGKRDSSFHQLWRERAKETNVFSFHHTSIDPTASKAISPSQNSKSISEGSFKSWWSSNLLLLLFRVLMVSIASGNSPFIKVLTFDIFLHQISHSPSPLNSKNLMLHNPTTVMWGLKDLFSFPFVSKSDVEHPSFLHWF